MKYVVDLLVLLLLLGNVVLGWRFGVLGRLAALAGLFGGVALASFAGNALERFFHGGGVPGDLYAGTATYLLLVTLVVAILEVLAYLYHERARALLAVLFDRTIGVVAGAFVGFLEAGVFCVVLLAAGHAQPVGGEQLPVDRAKMVGAVNDSVVGSHVAGASRFVETVFQAVLPSDLGAHLAEVTG